MQTATNQVVENSGNLVRKQYLVSEKNIEKLNLLAKDKGTSAAEIVRLAIDAYNPLEAKMDSGELMELVSMRLKEAIESTQNTNKLVSETLEKLEDKQE